MAVHLKIDFSIHDPMVLKADFLKIKGVAPVIAVEKENMMILFTKIHPKTLLKIIKQMGVDAEMLYADDDDDDDDDDNGSKSTKHCKASKESNTRSKKIPKETSEDNDDRSGYFSHDDKANRHGRRKHRRGKKIQGEHVCENLEMLPIVHGIGKKKDDHVEEAYEKAAINPLICRDFYCKSHAQRGIIHNKVPSIDSVDHPCHNIGFHNRFGMEGNTMFEDSVPYEYFPQRNLPAFPGYDPYHTSIMPRNHDYAYSRMAMPYQTGYDDYGYGYSRQAMPLPGYDARMSYPTQRPMPRYDDEYAYSGHQGMPFNGCGNQYR